MAEQSTPKPERATQAEGKQIPIEDANAASQQEGAAEQGGAPEAADAASDVVKEAEEALEGQPEEAAPPTTNWSPRRKPKRRTGRTSTCACMLSGTRIVVARQSSASKSASAPAKSWSRSCSPSSMTSSAPSTTLRRTAKRA